VHGLHHCVEYCPVLYPDASTRRYRRTKPSTSTSPRPFPWCSYIDESCLYLKRRNMPHREGVCENKADRFPADAEAGIKVGAVLLSLGTGTLRSPVPAEYHYGEYPNVVTSMTRAAAVLHRGLRRGDPAGLGPAASPKDRLDPSASVPGRSWKATTVIAQGSAAPIPRKAGDPDKDHHPEAECTVFHNDIRFSARISNAISSGPKFCPACASSAAMSPSAGDPGNQECHHYGIPPMTKAFKEEEFDMVVLSVG